MSEQAPEETLDARRAEIAAKLNATRGVMAQHGVDALQLTTIANTAWITAGAATYVNESVNEAALSILVTAEGAYILTDPIEEPRLRNEEQLDRLGFTFVIEPWHSRGPALANLISGQHIASDSLENSSRGDLRQALVTLRSTLTLGEQARMRAGAKLAIEAMHEAALAVRPGMREYTVAANLMAASRRRGGAAIVTLVGSDARIFDYRHPLPSIKPIERYVMLVLCFRYHGLVTALTRSVYFGVIPEALRETAQAVARIDARMISGTQPDRSLTEMFALSHQAYMDEGQPNAIEEHHQGGPIAYLAREALATPGGSWRIATGQAFAWNPSLRGAKSEDTILLTENGPEILTKAHGWPVWRIETPVGVIERPAILSVSE